MAHPAKRDSHLRYGANSCAKIKARLRTDRMGFSPHSNYSRVSENLVPIQLHSSPTHQGVAGASDRGREVRASLEELAGSEV
jgi:hypothetical protein